MKPKESLFVPNFYVLTLLSNCMFQSSYYHNPNCHLANGLLSSISLIMDKIWLWRFIYQVCLYFCPLCITHPLSFVHFPFAISENLLLFCLANLFWQYYLLNNLLSKLCIFLCLFSMTKYTQPSTNSILHPFFIFLFFSSFIFLIVLLCNLFSLQFFFKFLLFSLHSTWVISTCRIVFLIVFFFAFYFYFCLSFILSLFLSFFYSSFLSYQLNYQHDLSKGRRVYTFSNLCI